MGPDSHDDDEHREDEREPDSSDVDEASEESFPAAATNSIPEFLIAAYRSGASAGLPTAPHDAVALWTPADFA